ncbi:excinuclease ABC subunit UvrA [Bacteroidota bacterium]
MPEKPEKKGKFIEIKGARVHNLKNIDVTIPRNKFIVITGLSGSGKSSLAFDTLYAEGQRRYVESLSSYARQFLGRMHKPEVDMINGIPPAIAIGQKVNTHNPRSTVGTTTEIYDYLKLLFARTGKTYSPLSNKLVKHNTVNDVADYILNLPEDTKFMILTKYEVEENQEIVAALDILLRKGETRIESKGKIYKITDLINNPGEINISKRFNLVIDRAMVKYSEDFRNRISDSIQTAFFDGKGKCIVKTFVNDGSNEESFSNIFEADGILFEEPNVHMFSFNSPVGACKRCEGYGQVIGIDENLVIPDKNLSIYQDAIACWRGEKMKKWKDRLIFNADKFNFPIHKPYYELSLEQKGLLWTGNRHFKGINAFFKYVESKNYKIQYRVMLARYRGKTICPECKGTRLKKEAAYVKVSNKNIQELVNLPLSKLLEYIRKIKLSKYEEKIASRILIEIKSRLEYLCDVGLEYLTLNRLSSTLSGGESQRINLANSLGSSLVGSLYILDEPSIGLHPRDTNRLIKVLKHLQGIGNSVIVVEHDEEIIRASDQIIDIGPKAGRLGGEIIFQGGHEKLLVEKNSLTAKYLNEIEKIEIPEKRKTWNNYIEVIGAFENNLKGINVKFPLNIITVITGVSGSGKSSLIKNVLFNSLNKYYNGVGEKSGKFGTLKGDINLISNVEFVNQNPIGKSSRSNPVTYIKAYDEIRKLFANQQASKLYGYKPSHFSFNIDGGRCEECAGEGIITVEMQFMADVELICESCNGKRFKEDILDVKYNGKNIFNVLELTVNEAIEFFSQKNDNAEKKIIDKLQPLQNVGLGYVKLGQSSNTLSGGESQRVKLASFLIKEKNIQPLLFIFDEPTTGLHFHDIKKLLTSFNALIERGHSVIIIEHNLEIIKSADWIIDLGPEGGDNGGHLIFEGIPENIIKVENSYTGKYLKNKIEIN